MEDHEPLVSRDLHIKLTQVAPCLKASRIAAAVFSGASVAAPRWAMSSARLPAKLHGIAASHRGHQRDACGWVIHGTRSARDGAGRSGPPWRDPHPIDR